MAITADGADCRGVLVNGAGVAGLTAALLLAGKGVPVTILERAAGPGGKMLPTLIDGRTLDTGPTVFTMRWVFEQIFADIGERLSDHVTLKPLSTLARHAWSETERLDLFADPARSADAIGAFAGAAEARAYQRFCRDARAIYDTLETPFIKAARPSLYGLFAAHGISGLPRLMQIQPFSTMWSALGRTFRDARLRQLFARYATYCGSSPFHSPATLMLVAHVESEGVWSVEGGMHRLVDALAALAMKRGVRIRYGCDVVEIVVRDGRASGVRLAGGERIEARAVVAAGDVNALAQGFLGRGAQRAAAPVPPRKRSLSAFTWALAAPTSGFPLERHNVFFSRDYAAEFDDIFASRTLPREPTVYVCAQDRDGDDIAGDKMTGRRERLLVLVNAPPDGDWRAFTPSEIEQCAQRTFGVLTRCGLTVTRDPAFEMITTPQTFAQRFPGTGGALYGRSSHGWMASFARPGARSKVRSLYLASGSIHPGPGVPMAALSGRAAAESILTDFASTGTWRGMATPGGTSTPSATTAVTASR